LQLDGGTHVKSTKEVGRIKIVKRENKGKNNRRITIVVE
jgi:misacylated tRNA(Ala) deacylase